MKQSSQLFHDSIDNTANQRVTAQTPLDIMEEYNGCSVPQYSHYATKGNDPVKWIS